MYDKLQLDLITVKPLFVCLLIVYTYEHLI